MKLQTLVFLSTLVMPVLTLAETEGQDAENTVDHSKMDHSQHQAMSKTTPAQVDHSKMDHSQHQAMRKSAPAQVDHSKMDHSQHQAMSKTAPAQMDHSKMDHSQHQAIRKTTPAQMDHSKMDHSQHQAMRKTTPAQVDHSQHQSMDHSQHRPAIPVSDGSLDDDIPMPYEVHKMEDDPTLVKVIIDQFEARSGDGSNPVVLEAEAWIGKDLHKLWLKTELEYVDSMLEEAEVQLLYSRAIHPYWDIQVGVRHDIRPSPSRSWLAVGVKGLAPYFFEVDAALFVGKSGNVGARLQAEYELMLTQRLVLSPEIEINAYSKSDPAREIGSGLSSISAGLRLRYEIKREFAPYIGINWSRKLGGTADFARLAGEDIEDVRFVAGIRAWF